MLGDLHHFGDLLRRNADLFPGELALASGDDRRTWAELYDGARRTAAGLHALGLEPGDRVALLAENSVPYVEALFALAGAGLVAVPVNYRLRVDELETLLADAGARALLFDARHRTEARALGDRLETLFRLVELVPAEPPDRDAQSHPEASSGAETGIVPSADLRAVDGWEGAFDRPIAGDDLLLLLYTSGTTGLPKGVMYSHASALWTTLIHVLAIGSAHRHRVLLPSPLYSAAGFAGISCAVAVGSPIHLLHFSVSGFLETVARERITFTNLVPTTLRMILDDERFDDFDLSSLEVLLYGGSPMPEATLREAAERLGCGFRQTFATSETGLSGTVLEPEEHRRALEDPSFAGKLRSCGRPQVGVGVRLVDDDWNTVPHGEEGEIAVSCPGNMVGYWNRPEATAEVLRDGWLRTGDIARRDAEGYFYLLDRKRDMIVTGALNVFPSEVERAILEHEAVAGCAVIGIPDERWGEAVTALVVPEPDRGAREEEILAFARERLADFKRPKSVRFIDTIPYNAAGKPLRRLLREPYWRETR